MEMRNVMRSASFMVVALALLVPVTAVAQTVTTHEIQDGTVIYTNQNTLLVELSDGSAKLIEVDPDFRFDLDGKKVATSELKPGTKLKATVTTTKTPKVVKVTEVKSGTIIAITGNNITVRTPEGTKMFRNIPNDFVFDVRGKKVNINKITEGMRIDATIIVEEVKTKTEKDVKVKAKEPKE
jgi:RNase P/RNase MRP subunit p29